MSILASVHHFYAVSSIYFSTGKVKSIDAMCYSSSKSPEVTID